MAVQRAGEFRTIRQAAQAVKVKPPQDGPLDRPKRGEMQDRVVMLMKRALMVGQFVPGQPMSIRQLAQRLGTSPMPVREAISQLTAAGVLEVLPNRSVCVAHMTEARFGELTAVRVSLEGMAAAMACRNQTPALLRTLEKINSDLLKAISARDILGCLSNNQAFHFALYEASQAEIVPGLIEALWLRSGPFMYFSLTDPATPWRAEQHRDVLDALRANDVAATRRAVEKDISDTAKYIVKRSNRFRSDAGPMSQFWQ